MALNPDSRSSLEKAFDPVSSLVMIRLFTGFSLGVHPAKAMIFSTLAYNLMLLYFQISHLCS